MIYATASSTPVRYDTRPDKVSPLGNFFARLGTKRRGYGKTGATQDFACASLITSVHGR